MFFLILAIGSFSLLVIFSINRSLSTNQLIFWALGLIIFYFFSHYDYKSFKELSLPFYALSIFALLFLLLIGDPVRGSVRWIDLGFFRIQPSELAKAATIFVLARFYSTRSAKNLKNLITGFLIILPPVLLVLIEPDIGNSLAFLGIWLGIAFASGFRIKHFLVLTVIGILLGIISFELLASYQKERLTTFLDPNSDPLGTGYNIIQAKIAAGSGGLWGKGLGHGSQSELNFLPEAESDFIFASISEQLGLLGGGMLIIFFVWACLRIVSFTKDKDKFGQLVLVGITSFLLLQFVVNVGMNMGLLPVTGITFPLVSYGGSSLITTLFLLGVAFSINRWR